LPQAIATWDFRPDATPPIGARRDCVTAGVRLRASKALSRNNIDNIECFELHLG